MNKVKKLLIYLSSFSIPLLTFSCSSIKEKVSNDSETEFEKKVKVEKKVYIIYYKIEQKLNEISKVDYLFVPTTSENQTKIDEKNGFDWEFTFFDHVTNPLYSQFKSSEVIKISSKDEFNNIIVKRYQELNSVDDYKPTETNIVSEFEKRFLNNQKIDVVLETNDLYILQANNSGSFSYLAIPFISNDSVELNILHDTTKRIQPDLRLTYQKWKVFTLPKKQNFKINTYFADNEFPITGSASEAKEYYDKLNKWYNEEFKKFYKD
ncbi:hypothetical protein [Mycoplasmopsis bovirhinis]|uniref:hypothetical protein n=1 Tax=Mycoplasmopsis bovirhinis TaxID=29553 RepID=UPI000E7517A0|nr:hypothetical protein [Mycoplasmopsis bovirhinis]